MPDQTISATCFIGIHVIEETIIRGILDPEQWELVLVGKNIPSLKFSGNFQLTTYENLSWSEYAQLIGTVDVGLSLMYTPHPSYPPLDLTASGAIVVTNRFEGKHDLSFYSSNLICADLDQGALVNAIETAIAIASNVALRNQNYLNNRLSTDWHNSLAAVIESVSDGVQ